MNILLLSAGGPAAVGVIKSLRHMNFDGNIVTVDCDDLAVGSYMSDNHYAIPRASSDEYIWKIYDIVSQEGIDLILPTGNHDIVPISKNASLLESIGVTLFMSSYDSIQLCKNKFAFYERCKNNFPVPKTSKTWKDLEFPLFAKPMMEVGGSRGARICENNYQIEALDKQYEYIYQENLSGQEYSIDVLCDMKSNPLVAVPRKRIQTKAGISYKGEIIRDEFMEKVCFDICRFLNLRGPICIQMKEDESGNPKFVEINPRFGGATYFSTLAGVNFAEIILDLVDGILPKINEPKLVKILRYFEEVVV